MDSELRQYLNAIVILLCLNVGLLTTFLWVSADGTLPSFFILSVVGAVMVGWIVWLVADAFA